MAGNKFKEAVEFTTFKLNGVSPKEFIEANRDVDEFLKQRKGFLWRKILQSDNETIVDILGWDSVENGTAAMHALLDELADSPVHGTISQSTVSWNIAPVLHHI